jgi:hypothetical protein
LVGVANLNRAENSLVVELPALRAAVHLEDFHALLAQ